MQTEILARVIRGETVESIHRGSIVVIDGNGERIASVGDPEVVTFTRSSVKAFQAIPLIASGAADAFGFSEKEIALACASHSGEHFHTDLALSMLERAGLDESDLGCGAHPPFHEETAHELIREGEPPTPVHNNCSGKHAAMLALARHIGADTSTYLDPANPVQIAILESVSLFSGVPAGEIKMGTDGCSAPNFAMPLSAMARAYANLINPPEDFPEEIREAARRIVHAKMAFPEYVGGSFRLDTKVMKALPRRIVCKVGAEGVWLAGILPTERWKDGVALALKIDDGDDGRARPVTAVTLLRMLGVMTSEAEETLGEFSPIIMKNRMNKVVGRVESAIETLPCITD
jgi:L-asparaginase II